MVTFDTKAIANRHIKVMYRNVCIAVSIATFLLPLFSVWYAYSCNLTDIPASLSEYYLTAAKCSNFRGDWGRSWFVGTLFIVGWFLMAFPALTRFQLWLKLSGVLALMVALFPMEAKDPWVPYVHGAAAGTLFVPIVLLCLFPQLRTEYLIADVGVRRRIKFWYHTAATIIVFGALHVLAMYLTGSEPRYGRLFWLETYFMYGLGIFWWTRAIEVLRVADGV